MGINRPFTSIADLYDVLMRGIEYREWIDYTVALFDLAGLKPKKILDLACGTGSATVELVRRGFEVIGLDKSPQMLKVFKTKKKAHKVKLVEGDMSNFTLDTPVDAVTCYFDSVNYLNEERSLRKCFSSVYNALNERGIFVFDMNTIYGLEKVWGTNTLIREFDYVYSIWKSVYDASRHTSTLYLTLFVKSEGNNCNKEDCYNRIEEIHQERAYPMHEVKKMLLGAGFNKVEIFAHMTTSTYMDISSRVMVVAEKTK
jgi:ubiquinone/menaquinone biosynthesis C-methylase UbiE